MTEPIGLIKRLRSEAYRIAEYGLQRDHSMAAMVSMTDKQYRNAIDKLGLTQAGAAEFLGVSIRTSHGYANGEPIPEGYAKLLRLMVRLNLKPEDVK